MNKPIIEAQINYWRNFNEHLYAKVIRAKANKTKNAIHENTNRDTNRKKQGE